MRYGRPDRAVATSKTFRPRARVAGAAASSDGPYVRRVLCSQTRHLGQPGCPRCRSGNAPEGRAFRRAGPPSCLPVATVADAAIDLFGVPELVICPWALREGVILRRPLPARADTVFFF